MPFKLLSLNIHKGFSTFNRRFVLHELREAVRGVAADIVFLQEVLGGHADHGTRHGNWPEKPQYEFLADSIWGDFAYGRNAVYPRGHHGNAVLSKFPILRYHNHDISIAGPEKRGLLHCVMQPPEAREEMHAICVHLSLMDSHREQQIKLLCKLIEKQIPPSAPLLIAGDFNDWRLRAHVHLIRGGGVREAFVEAHGAAARTFPARLPVLKLDRIYFRNATVTAPTKLSKRPWSHLSDHAALTAQVTL